MKIKKQKTTKQKKIIITILLIATLALASGGAYYLLQNRSEDTQQERGQEATSAVDKEKRSDQDSGSEPTNGSTQPPVAHENEKDIAQPYEGNDVNSSPSLSGAITYNAVSGDTLVVRTTINQVIGAGSCEITLSNSTRTVTKTSNIAQNPSSSTCEGFDIPTAELGAGTWNISIKVQDTNNRNVTLTGVVNI